MQNKPQGVTRIPGFGPKSTQALQQIGIISLAQIQSTDPYVLYAQLKASVPGTSLNFLYKAVEKRFRGR